MKNILKSILALSIIGSTAYGDCDSGKWCSNVKVDQIRVMSSGTILVSTSGDESKLRCSAVNDRYMTVDVNVDGAKSIYSLLLTAQTTGNLVTVRTDTNSNNCRVSYVYMQ